MILKYSLLALFATLVITASDPYFGVDFTWRPVPKEKQSDVKELPWKSAAVFERYLSDRDDRINDDFSISPYFFSSVHFWFLIYTQFDSNQVVIHDKANVSLIYKVLDFSSLHSKSLPKNTLYILQQKLSNEKVAKVKEGLNYLILDPLSKAPRAQSIYQVLRQAKVSIPETARERKKFFQELKDNLRTQTGQRNFIRDGIVRSLPYQNFLSTYFEGRGVPKELLAIPFLESSFNPNAHSRANALGVWQFMPLIASYFVPSRRGAFDYRSNVGVASVSAGFLLEENHRILKRWDLAVTAYNSGTKHLLKTKRSLAASTVGLEEVIENSDSRHFGFASKNFYSEFLALVHALAYREEIFPGLHDHDRKDVDAPLRFYMLKCSLRLEKVLSDLQFDDVTYHNHHIGDFDKLLPRGLIITTKSSLPTGKFFQISDATLMRKKPKDWIRSLPQSCSTR